VCVCVCVCVCLCVSVCVCVCVCAPWRLIGSIILVSFRSSSLAHRRVMDLSRASLSPDAPEVRWMHDACIAIALVREYSACGMLHAAHTTSDESRASRMEGIGVTSHFMVEVRRGNEQRGVLRLRLRQHFQIVVDDIPGEHEGR
jgi:hypothetical protein